MKPKALKVRRSRRAHGKGKKDVLIKPKREAEPTPAWALDEVGKARQHFEAEMRELSFD